MRKIGLSEIEDIALGASLLGAGGGGDPYIGKLVAMGAVKERGPVTLLDPEEIPDDALVVPIAMMGAPTILGEKGVGGKEYAGIALEIIRYLVEDICIYANRGGRCHLHATHRGGGQAGTSHGGRGWNGPGVPGASDGDIYHGRHIGDAHGPGG